MDSRFRQDMPPEGGYPSIRYERVFAKRVFNKWALLAVSFPLCSWGLYHVVQAKKYARKLIIEKTDALLAVEPFVQAERDRAFLKQLIKLRKDETELMANKPGWTVGTLYGEKFTATDPPNTIPNIHMSEYYAHRNEMENYNWAWPDRVGS